MSDSDVSTHRRSASVGSPLPAEHALIEGLRRGDEAVFATLVDRYHASLVRVAMHHVPSRAVAEEVAQETWLAVIEGIDRFEGRSSFKTWLFRILLNRARTRGVRERRTTPLSSLSTEPEDDRGPVVPPERFRGSDALWAGHWAAPPRRWEGESEARLLAKETWAHIDEALALLPAAQRDVLVLRDVCGLSGPEACEALGVSEANQRVLLHRARSRVRASLEHYLDDDTDSAGGVA
ncbi:MAG: sigma-70 family RNA polymerase sigma factor [Acidimicrobiia bacterium]|nr:sigma-70 family RNA polymerase sigma factor [Acidimicrobiia bacterium]